MPAPRCARVERKTLAAIRRAVADYIYSEGCSCCRGSDHGEHQNVLGKLLRVKKYSDGSGYDFTPYRTSRRKSGKSGGGSK